MWMGLKSMFGCKHGWAASVAMHIATIGRLNHLYAILNYEINFYNRYHMMDNSETVWAQEEPNFRSLYLHRSTSDESQLSHFQIPW
jgi:hypothetical protein